MATSFANPAPKPSYNMERNPPRPDTTVRTVKGKADLTSRFGNRARWADHTKNGWIVTDLLGGVVATNLTRNQATLLINRN